jgi:hypothetical protein
MTQLTKAERLSNMRDIVDRARDRIDEAQREIAEQEQVIAQQLERSFRWQQRILKLEREE